MTEIEGWQTLDDNGIKMPWYTRPCLEWLESIDLKGKKVFEYGVGYSTLWFRSKGATVFGVDNNPKYSQLTGTKLVESNKIGYIKSIYDYEPFDIISVDGLYRDECTQYALQRIKKGGFIILDNYKQTEVEPYWPVTEELIKELDYIIYKEPTHLDWSTLVIHA